MVDGQICKGVYWECGLGIRQTGVRSSGQTVSVDCSKLEGRVELYDSM